MTASNPAAAFRQEARDLLDRLEEALLDLARRPDDQHLVDSVCSTLHTIKGSGAAFGFDAVAAFVDEFETALDGARNGQVAVTFGLVSAALAAKDHIFKLIEHADEAGGAEILDRLRATVGAAAPLEQQDGDAEPVIGTWRVRFRLPPDALISGANPLLLLDEIRGFGDCSVTAITDKVPPLERLDAETCYLGWDVIVSTDRPQEAIDDVFRFLRDDMELEVEPVEEAARLGELLVERGHVSAGLIAKTLGQPGRLGDMLVDAGVVSRDQVSSALAEQQHLKKLSNRETAE